jgi:signal transduction histidine kinase
VIQLSRAKEKAEESNRLKTAFLQNLSHQIRTPLNSIVGFIDLLATTQLTNKEKNHFNDLVKEGSQNLLNTIQNIVDISKLETKQVEINKTAFSLNKLMKELLESLGNKNSAEVALITEPELIDGEDQVVFDREKLFSCLYRIIGNSVKYTSKGSIIFGYAIAGPRVDFWIKDTGKGIPKELTHQLFELFQNASLPATFQPHGIGLGLAIVKQYVELLNGHIWFETEQNKGTSFYLSFPYQRI